MKSIRGFTLIEMLAATVILGVLITVVLGPLSQLFQNTGRSAQKLQATTRAQELIEHIRGQWQSYPVTPDPVNSANDINASKRTESRRRYDKTCYTPLPAVAGLTRDVEVRTLDRKAVVGGTLALTICDDGPVPANTDPPPMKRVSVTIKTANGDQSQLTLDMSRP